MSKWWTLSWFKENKPEEKIEEIVKLAVKEALQENKVEKVEEAPKRVYKNLMYIGDYLTVIFDDGDHIGCENVTEELFNKVQKASSKEEITSLLSKKSSPVVEVKIEKKASETVPILIESGEFFLQEDSVYMTGINRSIPLLLVNKFAEVISASEGDLNENLAFTSLKKFWQKCCLNPNAASAEDLYVFLSHHQFKIDRHGNFYAYRRVVSNGNSNKDFVEFISNTYTKVRAIWKKNPVDYYVHNTAEGYKFNKEKQGSEGNLKELYLNLPSLQEKSYTSAHTRQEDYRVGEIISMPRDMGDDNNQVSCSRGFHAASKAYDYSGFGDTPILVIINPMDVLSVPVGEVGKLRTCRWFFASILNRDEQHILDEEDFDVSDLGDEFEDKCLENLEEHVKQSFTEEIKRHTFDLSHISSVEMKSICSSLQEMNKILKSRVETF